MLRNVPLIFLMLGGTAVAGDHFELREIATRGRCIAAEIADLDGDGKGDLVQMLADGVPPNERRSLRIHPAVATLDKPFDLPWPSGAAAYDIADVRDRPGAELIFLRQSDVLVVSIDGEGSRQEKLPLPGLGSIAPRDEERGVARMQLVYSSPGRPPWIVVPQLGSVTVMAASGTVLGQLAVGGVATYYIFESPGLGFAESPVELHYTPARLSSARVDHDELVDLVAATRHSVLVFLQRPDGTFPRDPDSAFPLSHVSEADHIRGSGGATAVSKDIDGDGYGDLLISSVAGGISDARTQATIHLNRAGTWDLAAPDQTLEMTDRGSLTLIDLVGDDRPELVQMTTPFSVFEIIEALTTRAIDANVAIFRNGEGRPFEAKPWTTTKLGLPISFETFAPKGFLPSFDADLNGDGNRDLIISGSGDQLEVYLGGDEYRFQKRAVRQRVGQCGALNVGDFDSDGLADLVLFDPRRPNVPVKLLRNRGALPGRPTTLRAADP